MSCKTSSDFGLFVSERRKEEGRRWFLFIGSCGSLIVIFLCILNLFRPPSENTAPTENKTYEDLQPQKLSRSISDLEGEKEAPRPFGIDFKAPVPAAFGLSSTTEKITTISYPQLARYKHSYQPRNIQDILRYTAPILSAKSYEGMAAYQNQDGRPNYHQYPMQQNQFPSNQRYGFQQMATNHDPFYAFKPEDPSDINLMATASVRFAPPAWKNMHPKAKPNPYPNHQADMSEHSHIRNMLRDRNKQLVVTLNIFPMTDHDKMIMTNPQYQGQFSLFGRMMANSELAARSSNMVVKFNLFPEAFTTLNRQDRLE